MPAETQASDAILVLISEILKRPGSLIETFDNDRIVIRRSTAARLLLTAIAGICAVLTCGLPAVALLFLSQPNVIPRELSLFMGAMAFPMGVAFCLTVLQAGPLRLDCDLHQRTYRFTRSTPVIVTTTGSFSDFASVSVQSYQTASTGGSIAYEHRVLLTWKVAPLVFGRPSPTLIAYVAIGPDDADAMARALGARLGIPFRASQTS